MITSHIMYYDDLAIPLCILPDGGTTPGTVERLGRVLTDERCLCCDEPVATPAAIAVALDMYGPGLHDYNHAGCILLTDHEGIVPLHVHESSYGEGKHAA